MVNDSGARLVAFGKMAGEAGMFCSVMNVELYMYDFRNDQYFTWTGFASTITWISHSIHGNLLLEQAFFSV